MGLVTYVERVVALALLPGRTLPRVIRDWLEYVPAAVLSGLATVAILYPSGTLRPGLDNPWVLAAIPTVAVAAWRRSLWLTIVVGVAVFAALLALGLRA